MLKKEACVEAEKAPARRGGLTGAGRADAGETVFSAVHPAEGLAALFIDAACAAAACWLPCRPENMMPAAAKIHAGEIWNVRQREYEKIMKQFLFRSRNFCGGVEVVKDAVFWTAEFLRKLSTYL